MKIISTKKAPSAIGPYSQAISANGFLFVSGQIALDPENGELVKGGIKEQTEQVLKNLQAILNEAGLNFENVVKTTIFVKNMSDFALINEVYGNYFNNHKPARATVEISSLPKDALVEIECVALLN